MNIQSNNTIVQANNSLENHNKEEILFTVKLVKSGLADMLWQLSILYRIGELLNYTYVHTVFAPDKRHRLSLFGKINNKIENFIVRIFKFDRYADKIINFLGFDTIAPHINEKKFIDYQIVEVPIYKIFHTYEITDVAQLKKYLEKFVSEINVLSKKVVYCLKFTPELYELQLDKLLNSTDPEAIKLKSLKLKLSDSYRKSRVNKPINIPLDTQKIKIVVHLRKGDRVRLNINNKILGIFSSKVKIFENTKELNEWESINYSSSNDTYNAYNLLQKIFDRYDSENFSVMVISDGYERTFQNIRYAMSKGEVRLNKIEKKQLNEITKIANNEFDIFSNYSNVYTMIGESEENMFSSIHAIVNADILIKTTGGFAWVLHGLFKNQSRPSMVIQLGENEEEIVEKIGCFLSNLTSKVKNY